MFRQKKGLKDLILLSSVLLLSLIPQVTYSQTSHSKWLVPAMYRLNIVVNPGNVRRVNTPVGVALDFKEIFKTNNLPGRISIDSIRVTRNSTQISAARRTNRSGEVSIPFQLTGDFANDDAGIIWWRINDNRDTHFQIYFDSLNQRTDSSRTVGLIGIGDTFHYNDGRPGFAGNAALHSQYWHIDWDGDGRRDLIGFGYRTYEYRVPLEKDLGNWVYFYKNIGSAQKPLFAPRHRVKDENGNYLTTSLLPQNMFPVDWDNDGDIDFHGMSGDKLLLFENTGKRDRNNLWLLRQPRTIMEIKERSAFQKTLPIPPLVPQKNGFFPRGEKMVDWEGDGDRDLLIAYRTINVIGVQDPSKGVVPYGTGWTSFSLLKNIGTDERGNPRFATPETIIEERGLPIMAPGAASGGAEYIDYDGDGDLDLLYTVETNSPLEQSRLMLAENIGTRDQPLFIMPVPILSVSDSPFFVDWNDDGRFDLIAGGELFENVNPLSGNLKATAKNTTPLGTLKPPHHKLPRFVSRGLAQQINPEILTYFTTSVDFDGDGNLDLVSGYQSNIIYYRNKGATVEPVFDRGVLLQAAERPIFMPNWLDPQSEEPSHWGPQGMGEALFGWLVPTVADWDGDGDLDLFVTGQRWQIQYFENKGSRTKPILAKGREVRCDGDPFEFSWRSRVSVGDLDGDGHAELVVTSHRDNTFYMYKPKKRQDNPQFLELSRNEPLKLEDRKFIQGWYGGQNNNGDNHSQLVDWDSDGDLDLINGSLWAVFYYENVGTRQRPVFRAHGKFKAGGEVLHTFNHAGSFDAADWNGDGRLDLVMGTECPSDQPRGGVLHLFDRAFIENELPTARAEALEKRSLAYSRE